MGKYSVLYLKHFPKKTAKHDCWNPFRRFIQDFCRNLKIKDFKANKIADPFKQIKTHQTTEGITKFYLESVTSTGTNKLRSHHPCMHTPMHV